MKSTRITFLPTGTENNWTNSVCQERPTDIQDLSKERHLRIAAGVFFRVTSLSPAQMNRHRVNRNQKDQTQNESIQENEGV